MRNLLEQVVCGTAWRTGLLRLAMELQEPGGPAANRKFQLLVYHRVGDCTDAFVPAIPVAVFERHMRYLRRAYRVLPFSELLAAAGRNEVPPRAIAITFDDGYADTYRCAFPILRRYGLSAIVYLATGVVGDNRGGMWNDRLGGAFRDTRRSEFAGVGEAASGPLRTPQERYAALQRALAALKYRRPEEREGLVAEVISELEVPASAPSMLSWPQVREMSRCGIEFGAHTVHHPILTAVSSAEAEREIVSSKREIEQQLQLGVHHFAYPNGTARDFDETTRSLVRGAGFASAVSMVFGANGAGTDPFALRRGGPWEEATGVFATKLWWYRRSASVEPSRKMEASEEIQPCPERC